MVGVAWAGRGLAWTWPGFIALNAAAAATYVVLLRRTMPAEDWEAVTRWLRAFAPGSKR